ncbi:MAG: DUF1801 domain-containing protein [Actinomycetota bacterium]
MPGRDRQADAAAVDAFLARLPEDQRAALERLRRQIRSAAPEAVERIGYGMPMFYVGTSPLVGFSAWKNHLGFYGASGTLLGPFARALEGYETSKGTVRFTPERPLAAALVRKLVKARLAEHAGR